MSKKGNKDKEGAETQNPPSLGLLTEVCQEACSFSEHPFQNWKDVEAHARTLAPMMGIDPLQFQTARERLGVWKTSSAIFILLQMGSRIRNFAAYFCSLTIGNRASQFNPEDLLNRMARTTTVKA